MEPRRAPPEYFLEIFADTNSVKDVLKGTGQFLRKSRQNLSYDHHGPQTLKRAVD